MSQKGATTFSRFLIFILNVYGLFPKTHRSTMYYWIYWICSYIFHFFISFAFVIFALIYVIINITDIQKSTDSLCTTLTTLAYLFKIFNYYYYKEQIVNFVPKLYELQEENSPDETYLSNKKQQYVSRLSYSFLFTGHVAIGISCFKPFNEENPEMPLVCWYPLDWQNDSTSFWIVYPYSVICATVIMQVNITLDCFSYFLMDSIATQLDVTGKRLEQLGKNVESNEMEQQKLISCIKHHQHLLEWVRTGPINHHNLTFIVRFVTQLDKRNGKFFVDSIFCSDLLEWYGVRQRRISNDKCNITLPSIDRHWTYINNHISDENERKYFPIFVLLSVHDLHSNWSVLVHILRKQNINRHRFVNQFDLLFNLVWNACNVQKTRNYVHGTNEEEQRPYGWQIISNEFDIIYNGKNLSCLLTWK